MALAVGSYVEARATAVARSADPAGVAVAVRDVSVRYDRDLVLDSVSLDVAAGSLVTLLGPSGSGKTTLLMAVAGFAEVERGAIRFDDEDVTQTKPHRRNVGVVFQSYALFPHMTVAENVAYPLRLRRVPRATIERRVRDALATVRLAGLEDRRATQLSGGQRQRVALARAIVFQPRLLLMDEPLAALDKPLRDAMQLELHRLHRELGLTTLYVTHDQREALTLSDRIAVIDRGRIEQVGSPRALYESPRSAFVARFLGESTLLEVARSGDGFVYRGQRLRLRELPTSTDARMALLIRPERAEILPVGTPVDETANLFEGRVEDVVYQGESVLVSILLPDAERLTVRVGGRSAVWASLPSAGDTVRIAVAAEDSVLVRLEP